FKFVRHNIINKNDIQWMKQIEDVIAARNEKLPPIGMYNGGQKVLFWVLTLLTIGLTVTGLMIWREYFTFSADIKAVAVLLHAFMAFSMMGFITVHVLAAILAKGSIGAMLHGKVTYAWAKHHHSQWYKDIVEAENAFAIKK
ncbi:MAG: formate dehydrogenase subunit gamma, partial [Saezia sp.]